MYMRSRDEEVILIKKLLTEQPTLCPKCKKGYLIHFHQKAKKSNTRWKCPNCKEDYKVIEIIDNLPDC